MIKKVFDYLILNNKTISFAESCTGGSLSLSISKIPTASMVFKGSIISYTKSSKENVLDIERTYLDKYSTISREVAIQMAKNVMKKFKSDYSISITGNAGPSVETSDSSIGDCYISVLSKKQVYCEKYNINETREVFIKNATNKCFELFSEKFINQ